MSDMTTQASDEEPATVTRHALPCAVVFGSSEPDPPAIEAPARSSLRAIDGLPQRQVRVRAFICADDDGSHSAAVDHPDKATGDPNNKYRIEPADIVKLVNGANTYFKPSGIQFLFDPATDVEIRHDTRLNRESHADHERRMQLGRDYRGYLVVIFRYGGQGWSRPDVEFVIMPSVWNPQDMTFLAHEFGHYLHLEHSFAELDE